MKCAYCNPKHRPLFETLYWRVHLNEDQAYLGRCIVVLKRHAGTLSMLTADEWKDFGQMVKRVETTVTKAFEPDMFNWTCLLDDAYTEEYPDPHVHWHARPRYGKQVTVAGVTFEDPGFGKHYDGVRKNVVNDDVQRVIRERLLHYT